MQLTAIVNPAEGSGFTGKISVGCFRKVRV